MRRFLVSLILTTVLLLPFSSAQSQRQNTRVRKPAATAALKGAEQITTTQLRDYLTFIASDEMEGRDIPSRGLDLTAKFLAMNLGHWGLKPAGDDGTFFQKIALRKDLVNKELTKVRLNDQLLAFGEDYIALPANTDLSAPLVFAGNGWFAAAAVHFCVMTACLILVYAWSGNRKSYALLFPLGGAMLLRVFAHSLRLCATGKVEWRGTSYTHRVNATSAAT